MPARRLVAAVAAALAAAIVAACSEPDRSTAADELGDRIEAMASVADVTVSYNPDTAGSNESVRVLAVTEPAADPGDACATVAEVPDAVPRHRHRSARGAIRGSRRGRDGPLVVHGDGRR